MIQYQDLVRLITTKGNTRDDRTNTGTHSVFGHQMRFDLQKGFPLVTTKKTFFRGAAVELLWFLRGDTNIKMLNEHGVHIWDEWANHEGDLGPVYGEMWRKWKAFSENTDSESEREWDLTYIDQIDVLIKGLRDNPFSRRHIVSGWDPSLLPHEGHSHQVNVGRGKQALPPCHTLFQFYVEEREGSKYLSCQLYQRSADIFLGVPFNIASYALLTHMLAHHLDYEVGEFIWAGGDCHLYFNHIDQAGELLQRTPLPLPTIRLDYPRETPLEKVEPHQIELVGYTFHPAIKAPIAV